MGRDAITRKGYSDAAVQAVLALASGAPRVIGVSGLQGSGKSTLAAQLVVDARARGLRALSMSIDDFYLGRAARRTLARQVHPLLSTRGVPGTHDVALALRTLDALRQASLQQPAHVPRFDKGRDTRLPPSRWKRVTQAPDLIVLEGWCVGVPAQSASQLRSPVNRLERDEDPDARWRRWVNTQLREHYAALWHRLDRLVLLQAPGFDVVMRWRNEQEQALRARAAPRALSRQALQRFLQHYERLSRHALATLPARADLRIVLDTRRRVSAIVQHGMPRQPASSTTTAVP
jgi:D-glycerate 3-kinase